MKVTGVLRGFEGVQGGRKGLGQGGQPYVGPAMPVPHSQSAWAPGSCRIDVVYAQITNRQPVEGILEKCTTSATSQWVKDHCSSMSVLCCITDCWVCLLVSRFNFCALCCKERPTLISGHRCAQCLVGTARLLACRCMLGRCEQLQLRMPLVIYACWNFLLPCSRVV